VLFALALLFGLSGGELAGTCQYPSVVSFRGYETKCTGTLVHPEVMVTAAHCLEGAAGIRVRFGEAFSPRERIVDSASCSMHPEYQRSRAAAHDIGVCRLVSAVTDVPITPLAVGCELDRVQPDAEVTMVGFGITDTGDDFGSKRAAVTTVASEMEDDGTLAIGSADVGGCLGDSGGPALMRYPDGVWRTVAVLSTNPTCGTGPGRFVSVRDHVAWLEAAAERDLTPCHDADETFVGGLECRAFEADPVDVVDAWAQGCGGAVADPPGEACTGAAGSSSEEGGAKEAVVSGCTCRSAPSPLLALCFIGIPIARRIAHGVRRRRDA
jgi:secreted trypsin-like serine protease